MTLKCSQWRNNDAIGSKIGPKCAQWKLFYPHWAHLSYGIWIIASKDSRPLPYSSIGLYLGTSDFIKLQASR